MDAEDIMDVGLASNEPLCPESSLADALKRMEEVALTVPNNTAYTTALENCPELIDKESNRIRFLRFCNHDPSSAAKRLVGYWRLRFDTFGDRFCRPIIDFSGNGALSDDILTLLEQGAGHLVPPNKDGSMVIWADYSNTFRFNKRMGAPTKCSKWKLQVLFFLAQLCSIPEASLKNGVIYGQFVREQRHTPSPHFLEWLQRMGQDGFPFALCSVHYLLAPRDLPNNKKRETFILKAIPFITQMMKGPLSFTKREIDFVPIEKSEGLPTQRAKIGISLVDRVGLFVGSLPVCAGGPWSYQRMKQELSSPQGLKVYSEIPLPPTSRKPAPNANTTRPDNMTQIVNSPQGVRVYSDAKLSSNWKVSGDGGNAGRKLGQAGRVLVQEQKNPLCVLADAAALLMSNDCESQCSLLSWVDQKQRAAKK